MAPVGLYAVTLAVAARRLQDASCPCLQSPPNGTGYPTFTLAGTTISYEHGEPKIRNPDCSGPRHRAMPILLEYAAVGPNPI